MVDTRGNPPPHANKPTVDEAPTDGTTYGRRNAAWTPAAALESPTFTGQPQAPNPASGDDGDTIATTAFVQAAIAAALAELPPTEPPIEPPIEPPTEPPVDGTDDDGHLNAPHGQPQFPDILDQYVMRPQWQVAGVDYAVGIDRAAYPSNADLKNIHKCQLYSTKSLTIGQTGRVDFPVDLAASDPEVAAWFEPGQDVLVCSVWPIDTWQSATVASFTGTTIALDMTNTIVHGSGTQASWLIAQPYIRRESVNYPYWNYVGGNIDWINIWGPAQLDGANFDVDADYGRGIVLLIQNKKYGAAGEVKITNCYSKQSAVMPGQIVLAQDSENVSISKCEIDGNNGTQPVPVNPNIILDGTAGKHTFQYNYVHDTGTRTFQMACSAPQGGFAWDIRFNVFANNMTSPTYMGIHGDIIMLSNSGSSAPGEAHHFPGTILDYNLIYQSPSVEYNGGGGEIIFIRDDSPQTTYSGTCNSNTIVMPPPQQAGVLSAKVTANSSGNVIQIGGGVPDGIRANMIVTCSHAGFPNGQPVVGTWTNTSVTLFTDTGAAPFNVTVANGDTIYFAGGTAPCAAVVQESLIRDGFEVANNYCDIRGVLTSNMSAPPSVSPTKCFLDPNPITPGTDGSFTVAGSSKLQVDANVNMVDGSGVTFQGGTHPLWKMP